MISSLDLGRGLILKRLSLKSYWVDLAFSAFATIMTDILPKHALVICDVQVVALKALDRSTRESLLDGIQICIQLARRVGWKVLWSGLRFPSGYQGIKETHKLYGALKRLNSKVGDAHANWFLEHKPDTELALPNEANDGVVWRRSHMPVPELVQQLEGVTHVTVVGLKVGYSIQATVQALCDAGLQVSVVKECVADEDTARFDSTMNYLIPLYADIVSLSEWVDQTVGLETHAQLVEQESAATVTKDKDDSPLWIADCGRGAHFSLYTAHLLELNGWRRFALQPWYTDSFSGKSYACPLGKRAVAFCDEPRFSHTSMFLKGREWLDEKEKILTLVPHLMPATYRIERGMWVGQAPKDDDPSGPWFVKECDKNGGRAVQVCVSPNDCLKVVNVNSSYVVQAHVPKPLLTDDGRKCHIKFYSLLQCDGNRGAWQLHSYPHAFLSTSPNPWSAQDMSAETQITIKRHHRLIKDQPCEVWSRWPTVYPQCQENVKVVVETAISKNLLQPRPGKPQFEIFSSDFMIGTSGKAWLIECNFGPVLFDPLAGQELTTAGLKEYQRLYDLQGNEAIINDRPMIADTIQMVFGTNKRETAWDLIAELESKT
jgi:nicotinamidase-related amidase